MNIKNLIVIGSLGGLLAGCNIQQPTGACAIANTGYIARLVLTSSNTSDVCAQKKSVRLGLAKYGTSPTDPSTLAIRPTQLNDVDTADPQNTPNAVGAFSSVAPDGSSVCAVPTMTEAKGLLGAPINDVVSYQFANSKFFNPPEAAGKRWTSDLTYKQGSCTATYKVYAMNPVVRCATRNATTGVVTVTPDACTEKNRINNDYNAKCDYDLASAADKALPPSENTWLGFCVLDIDRVPAAIK